LDANILIRAVLGRRVRQLIESYSARRVRFVAPDVVFEDAQRYLPLLLKKRGKSSGGVSEALEYLRSLIQPIYRELYGEFETEARQRLRGRDEDDWPVLATALGLECPI